MDNPQEHLRADARRWVDRAERTKLRSSRTLALDMAEQVQDFRRIQQNAERLLTEFRETVRKAREAL